MSSRTRTLADIGEDGLIRLLTKDLRLDASVITGPGDDCAVVKALPTGSSMLLKTDAVVEGVHFLPETSSKLVGRKALARVVSDFAAMGGTPRHAMVTLIAPPTTLVKRVQDIYRGMRELAERFAINLVGGETTKGEQLILSISAVGSVPSRRWAARGKGKAGDVVLVTGRLGGSITKKHLSFEPRLNEGQWLVQHFPIHAMMDLSDGLAKDLPRMAAASGLGFVVDAKALPCTRGCSAAQAWGDGEDYELLLAVPEKAVAGLLLKWRKAFPKLELTAIGHLTRESGGVFDRALIGGGWEHFKS